MYRSFLIMIGSVVLVGAMVWMLNQDDRRGGGGRAGQDAEPLLLFCAASNQAVMEAIRSDYEKEFGFPVDVQYGASQTLLSS
ncbi:MAG: molybdate ABC transporter substrate-binding protein, partial [Pirellulales bacterium]|nr:molybdate ABC transporter substrate-binding protein [Pirellulales bacterium]